MNKPIPSPHTIYRQLLINTLNTWLEPDRFRDACPNGLQVEGNEQVQHIVFGVTASLALILSAVDRQADTIIVHHGIFWKNDSPRVIGPLQRRLKYLLQHNINLLAYHLPLDIHPQWGNNTQLGELLGFSTLGTCGEQNLIHWGELAQPMSAVALSEHVGICLQRTPLLVGDHSRIVKKVAWCTGAAQGMFAEAITSGCDLYLSGEISEPTTHLARESGVPYLAAGHHATERYGILALSKQIAKHHNVICEFIDIDNPA